MPFDFWVVDRGFSGACEAKRINSEVPSVAALEV